eukprot:GFUD01122415.1.p1 GENE.GFUD01122415.1~~GFUD01122415.1.p1  ORF type:complete len:160 (+),score=51.42 GFUD01122415.1:1-480(+)
MKDNVITKRGNRHTLLLTGIKKEDRRGSYVCRARNYMGELSAVIAITDEDSDATIKLEEGDHTEDIQNKMKVHVDQEVENHHEKAENMHLNNTEIEESSAVINATEEESNIAIKLEEHDRTGDVQSKPMIHIDKEAKTLDNKSENRGLNTPETVETVNS